MSKDSNPLWQVKCLTLSNLNLSETDKLCLKALSKEQRKALYNLGTIHTLVARESVDRQAAEGWREIVREVTLDVKYNKCEFDKTSKDKKLEKNPIRTASDKYANS